MPQSPRLLRPKKTFTPKSIAGLKLWLDVSNYGSLTFNVGAVSQINDLSGSGFHATQQVGNNQPTYQATGFNGKPCISGAGLQHMVCGEISPINMAATSITVCVVYRLTTWQTGTAPLDNNYNLYHTDYPSSGTSNFGLRCEQGSNAMTVRVGDADSSAPFGLGLTSAHAGQAAIHVTRVDGSSGAILSRVSGAQKLSNTVVAANLPASFGTRVSLLTGFSADQARRWNGDIAELMIYASALTLSDIQSLERYASSKYGISV